jgi:hypothetical protein
MARYSWLAALLVLGTAACGSGDDAAPADSAPAADAPASSGDDVTDIAEYELSMSRIDRMFAAQRNMALAMKDMTPAERDAMENTDMANGSLDEFARGIEANPKIRAAIEDAGMQPREYATATMAMVSAAMAASVLDMRPNDNQDSLAREMNANMDNITFIRENQAALTQKQQELEAELRAMGALDEPADEEASE